MEKISFIIPVYGVEDYLTKCLDSILTQSYEKWEAILIDDGSPDRCGVICDRYAKLDKRFKVIHSRNNGVAMARLLGFVASNGDYVSFVDADDWLSKDFLAIVRRAIQNDSPEVVILKLTESDKNFAQTRNFSYPSGFYDRKRLRSEIYPSLLANTKRAQSEIPGSLWGKVFRRGLLLDNMQYLDVRLRMGEDQVWVWPALMQAKSIMFCESSGYYYRKFPQQVTAHYHKAVWEMYSRVIAILRNANQDKKIYSGYDFSRQIDFMQAQFAVNAVDNEFLPGGKGLWKRYHVIRKISKTESLRRVLGRISYQAFARRKVWVYLLRYRLNFVLWVLEILDAKLRRH